MGIKDKATYGEHFWAMQVEAANFADEQIESAFAPFFARVISDIPYLDEAPAGVQSLIKSLETPPSAGFGGFALGVGVEMIDETLHSLMSPMMKMMSRAINRRAKETWLTSEQANTLFRQGKIEQDLWELIIESEGYDDISSKFLYQSQLPYPTISDLVLYARYHGDPDNPWAEVQNWFDVDARDWPVWKWLALQRLTTDQSHMLLRRGQFTEADYFEELSKIGWSPANQLHLQNIGWTIPNAMLLVQGDLQQGQTTEKILTDISIADINPKYAQTYLDAILTKPASTDLVAYMLRKDPSLAGLEATLQKIGIHPAYGDIYRTLAYPIPPTADLITMAVREAFTPAIAERFGQYEDFPAEFEQYAAMKGLTTEWARRYWAAHWTLPSAQQGFQMLHRGVIEENELDMLLRALDVMPFWRDKLTKIAYRRLTRVDIRRMYRVGVLSREEVYEAYLELGYNDRDAERMTKFTVKQTLDTQSKFTSRDIITAYSKRMINRGEARTMMLDVGVRSEDIGYIFTTADYKREWELIDDRIAGIRNLYKKQVYTKDAASDKLSALDLPAEQITVLMDRWHFEKADEPVRTWTTAQTLGFIKAGFIVRERGLRELREIGYDTEHINIFMKSIE